MFSVDVEGVKLVGGLAGLASLTWQLIKEFIQAWRRPRLHILPYHKSGDVNVPEHKGPDGSTESRRYICLSVQNRGWRTARGCIAWAHAEPVRGAGKTQSASLHWADSPIVYSSTVSNLTAVDILPRILPRRLDVLVATSNGVHPFYLCSPQALNGNYFADSELAEGEYLINVFVTFEDGRLKKSKLRVALPETWCDARADNAKRALR
jgi:hypothetical protein